MLFFSRDEVDLTKMDSRYKIDFDKRNDFFQPKIVLLIDCSGLISELLASDLWALCKHSIYQPGSSLGTVI